MGLAVVVVEQLTADDPLQATRSDDDVLVLSFGQATPLSRQAAPAADPGFDESTAPPAGGEGVAEGSVHVVRPGDTLSSIALQHLGDSSLAGQLAELNGLSDPDRLREGQRIRLR